jgi:NHLM bacteriocin system ABC transporter ATP-binding protein
VTTAQSAFSDFFTRQAQQVGFGVDRIATMADAKTLTLVEEGSLDLFAVDLGEILHAEALLPRAGTAPSDSSASSSARWTYLCRVEAGAMVVGAPSGTRLSLLGRPLPGARVSRLPVAAMQRVSYADVNTTLLAANAAPQDGPGQHEVITSIESGLIALADGIRVNLAPRDFVALAGGETAELAAGSAVRLVQGAGWLRVLRGQLQPGGNPDEPVVEAGEAVFVTGADWLVAQDEALVQGLNSANLLSAGLLWEALARQQGRYLRSVDRLVERRQQRSTEVLLQRRARDARVVDRAIRGFSAVVENGKVDAALIDARIESPQLAAMTLVAERLGLTVVEPLSLATVGRSVDGIEAIALASQLRTRSLRLAGKWWRDDLGPMIGYRQNDAPVALLPISRGYQLIDPAAGTVERVTPQLAKELSHRATMLYRPLPVGTRKPAQLLRFGLTGGRRELILLALSGLLVALLGLLVPILTGTVFGTFVPHSDRGLIVFVCVLILISGLVAGVFSAVQNLAILRLEGRADTTIQAAIWDRLLALPLRFFSDQSTGELTTAALAVDVVRETVSGVATTAALALLTGLLNLVLVFFYSVSLAFVTLGLVAISMAFCFTAGVRQVRVQREIFALDRKLSSRVFQLLTGLAKLRVAAAEDRAFAVWAGEFTESRTLTMRARRMQNMVTTFNAGFALVTMLVIFALVGESIHLSTGAFISFFAASTLLLSATLQFTGVAITILAVVPLVENLEPILTCEREISVNKSSPGELSGDIELVHVNFAYDENSPLVINDVSFRVRAGEFLAVVGPTGCGKSTLVRLLLGFDEPLSGSVLYDDQDLAQLDVLSVRRQCGVVLQNGALLAGDVRSNIIGNTTYSLDAAWEAARMSGLDKDIENMPLGMYTVLSEGASTLSGGQRQRLMIARALVSRPRILIMDEATSALDNPTQAQVAESTRQLHATRIVIAHRLSTIRHADRIVVLDAGRIVQDGTFEELVADEGGLFADLARRQFA